MFRIQCLLSLVSARNVEIDTSIFSAIYLYIFLLAYVCVHEVVLVDRSLGDHWSHEQMHLKREVVCLVPLKLPPMKNGKESA